MSIPDWLWERMVMDREFVILPPGERFVTAAQANELQRMVYGA